MEWVLTCLLDDMVRVLGCLLVGCLGSRVEEKNGEPVKTRVQGKEREVGEPPCLYMKILLCCSSGLLVCLFVCVENRWKQKQGRQTIASARQ